MDRSLSKIPSSDFEQIDFKNGTLSTESIYLPSTLQKASVVPFLKPIGKIGPKKQSTPSPLKKEKIYKNFNGIIGNDYKMLEIFEQINDVAEYECPVHITGDTGTGKELVAKAIHALSPRKNMPFVAINCGALPEGLVESELFGHVKGAFSGAIREKKGRFELAHGGTIFLDEVAELSKFMQVKLLRTLQDGLIEKVGGEKSISVNVRIISATNKSLSQEITNEKFREDLYYRLNVFPITLPPLCERKQDIVLLAQYFTQTICKQYNKKCLPISKEALAMLVKYKWPGNVRELQNTIQFAIIKAKEKIITPDCLPIEINIPLQPGPQKKLDYESVKSVLIKTGWNKAKAARRLGVGRATLYRFINNYKDLLECEAA